MRQSKMQRFSQPKAVLGSDSVAVFKSRLKTFLFFQAFSSSSASQTGELTMPPADRIREQNEQDPGRVAHTRHEAGSSDFLAVGRPCASFSSTWRVSLQPSVPSSGT